MKRWIALIAVMTMLIVGTVYADSPQYENVIEMRRAWVAADGMYPDSVGGTWYENGDESRLFVGLVDNEAGKQMKKEILDSIRDDDSVVFVWQRHPYRHLCEIMDELNGYGSIGDYNEIGLSCWGINEMDNRVDIGILKEKQNDPATQQWMKETTERYGDAVAFEYTEAYIAHTAKKTENDLYIVIPCYCLIFLLIAGVLVMGRMQSRVTTTGHTVNTVSMTDREVRRRVEASQPEFPASLDEKIKSMVRKE